MPIAACVAGHTCGHPDNRRAGVPEAKAEAAGVRGGRRETRSRGARPASCVVPAAPSAEDGYVPIAAPMASRRYRRFVGDSQADRERWAPVFARVRAISEERSRREARRRRLALVWKVPSIVIAGAAVGVAAARLGVPDRALVLLQAGITWACLTTLGALFAGGGAAPDWEYLDQPMPTRRIAIGAAVGFAAGALFFAAAVLGSR